TPVLATTSHLTRPRSRPCSVHVSFPSTRLPVFTFMCLPTRWKLPVGFTCPGLRNCWPFVAIFQNNRKSCVPSWREKNSSGCSGVYGENNCPVFQEDFRRTIPPLTFFATNSFW